MNTLFSKYQTIMFDLDGTLIDSAADLVEALNTVIADIFPSRVPYDGAKRLAGIGSRHLLRYAFEYHNTPYDDAIIESFVPAFLDAYQKNMLDKTTAFAGADSLLRTLKNNGKNLLLITNKPRRFTPDIIDNLGWTDLFDGIYCPEDVSCKKPSPQHLLEPLKKHNLNPDNALMVGDSITDYDAAIAANIPVMIVGFYEQTHAEFPLAQYFIQGYF
jgi:phosphoglycolate phosphatase